VDSRLSFRSTESILDANSQYKPFQEKRGWFQQPLFPLISHCGLYRWSASSSPRPHDFAGDWQNVAKCTTRVGSSSSSHQKRQGGQTPKHRDSTIPHQTETASSNTSPEIFDFVYGGGM
jgi:hypothetical protein